MEKVNNFAKNLAEERRARNISQRKLAEYLNVDSSLVYQWEHEKCEPALDTLCKISEYFDLPVDELLGIEAPYNSRKNQDTENKKKMQIF